MSQLPAQFPVGMVGRVSRSIPALQEEEWKGKAAQTTLSAQESFNILDFFFFLNDQYGGEEMSWTEL